MFQKMTPSRHPENISVHILPKKKSEIYQNRKLGENPKIVTFPLIFGINEITIRENLGSKSI